MLGLGFVGVYKTDCRYNIIFVGPKDGDEETIVGRLVGKCEGVMVGFVGVIKARLQ